MLSVPPCASQPAESDAVGEGARVLVVDDLLATGGTAAATNSLIRELGAQIVATCFVIELSFLPGREAIGAIPVHSIVTY